jgi:hypothetical protein
LIKVTCLVYINTWKIIGNEKTKRKKRKKKKQRKHLKLLAWITRYYRESVCAEVFLQWVCIAWQNKTENWQSGSEQKQSENQELLVEEKEAVSFSGILQTKQNKTQTQRGVAETVRPTSHAVQWRPRCLQSTRQQVPLQPSTTARALSPSLARALSLYCSYE